MLEVRRATIEDAPAIARVHVNTWQAAYRGVVPDEYLDAIDVQRRAEVWRSVVRTDDRPVWVGVIEGAVVGFVSVGPSRDEPGAGELYAIYVESGRWGAGVGRALMTAAVAWLRMMHAVATLWVIADNTRARSFYARLGWRDEGTTKIVDRGSFALHEVRYRIDL